MLSPGPRRHILILGGGDGMAAREALSFSGVESIDLVDLDPAVTDLFKNNELLANLNSKALSDPRVQVINGDALSFLERSSLLSMMSSSSICPTHPTFSSVSSTTRPLLIWSRDDWDRKAESESKRQVLISSVRPFGPSSTPSKPRRQVTQRILKRSRLTRITRWYHPSALGDLFSAVGTQLTSRR